MNPLASDCADGDIRLINSNGSVDLQEGRVELCINNLWGSVCNKQFDTREADVICRQLSATYTGLDLTSLHNLLKAS